MSSSDGADSEIIYGDELDAEEGFYDEDYTDEIDGEVALEEFDDFEDAERSISSAVTIGGEVSSLKVRKGDTLMLIAFRTYGDYSMWKNIRNMNPGINPHSLVEGQKLKYQVPEEEFDWAPAGKPYLIKRGDTLGSISNDKYGTPKKWRSLWENNRSMIKNPNLIFAGFTLYYMDGESDFAFNSF